MDTTVLTPNRRLAAVLLKKHAHSQIETGKTSWPSVDALPFSSWLQRLWHTWAIKQNTTPTVLSTNQEQILWEEILSQSPENETLLQLSATAELAQSAWSTLKQWRVDIDNSALKITEDGHAFQQWANQFQKICQQKNWIDTASLTDLIIKKIDQGDILPPSHIILMGFTEISPQYNHVLEQCKKVGSKITHDQPVTHRPATRSRDLNRISLIDEENEIRTMACWAKNILETHADKKSLSIGCIIPRLEKIRERVTQIFSDVFSEKNTYTLNHMILPLNISAGKSLASYPIIHTALQLLNLDSTAISLETLSTLLRSPFIGEAEKEMLERAQFENLLRSHNTKTFYTKTFSLKNLFEKTQLNNHCPALAKRLIDWAQLSIHSKTTLRTISEWKDIFIQQLNILGWPGERSINSQEYQVMHAWLELFSEYQTFAAILAPQTVGNTLHYLTELTQKTIFQPQSPEAPVQILGMLEAADIAFDYAWVMGLDDTAWPPAPKPNPLIPQRLQKKLNMPHATAERELLYCQQLMEQLKRSVQTIIFSHALKNADAELRCSALIQDFPEMTLDQIQLSPFTSPTHSVYEKHAIEWLHDEQAPPIVNYSSIRGGVNIFKQQAACPFKAFSEFRLFARAIESPTMGLRPFERGMIIHKSLETLWQELQNQKTLLAQDDLALKKLIYLHVHDAIFLTTGETIAQSRYLALEAQRLEKLLWDWLAQEKLRPDFSVIAREQETHATFGRIPLTVRIDRIDATECGHKIIIDYKTGKNNPITNWFDARLSEPQLPLYCLIDLENVTGIAFAQIKTGDMSIEGVSKTHVNIKSITPIAAVSYTDAETWEQQMQQWRIKLEKLENDFCQGDARIDPKNPNETCQHCKLQGLCRIHEYN